MKKRAKITTEQAISLANNEDVKLAKQSCEYILTKYEMQQTTVKISPKVNDITMSREDD